MSGKVEFVVFPRDEYFPNCVALEMKQRLINLPDSENASEPAQLLEPESRGGNGSEGETHIHHELTVKLCAEKWPMAVNE